MSSSEPGAPSTSLQPDLDDHAQRRGDRFDCGQRRRALPVEQPLNSLALQAGCFRQPVRGRMSASGFHFERAYGSAERRRRGWFGHYPCHFTDLLVDNMVIYHHMPGRKELVMEQQSKRGRYTIWPESVPAAALRRHWRWAEKRQLLEQGLLHLPNCQQRLSAALEDSVFADLAKKMQSNRLRDRIIRYRVKARSSHTKKLVNHGPCST